MRNGISVAKMSRVLVVCGPSGSGKSTLVDKLLSCKELADDMGRAVTHTTRAPRPGERNAVDYHFVSEKQMNGLIANGEMIESARFSGNLYGTSRKAVEDVARSGRLCVVIIDVQGVETIRNCNDNTLKPSFVFIRPPSLQTLRDRLLARNTESEENVDRRMKIAAEEMAYGEKGFFDLVIVNDDLSEAFEKLKNFSLQLIKEFKIC